MCWLNRAVGVLVHIDKFSGPMALLLHLIRREEMDIFDININQITKQYLESIRSMKKLNLEMAGDFIAMAATLIQIKSKMLLPQYNEAGEVIETEDPRQDLVKRLLEYQMYQEAGHNLYKRSLVGRDVWARGEREEIKIDDDSVLLEEGNALYALISCYRMAMKNMKKAVHKVAESLQSIAERILQMRELLQVGQTARFSDLVRIPAGEGVQPEFKGQVLITFLSLLELAKIGLVNLFQSDNFADIHVEAKGVIDRGSISNIEDYESHAQDLVGGSSEFWMTSEDTAAADNEPIEEQLPLAANGDVSSSEIESPLMDAATDEEIELEEKLYGQEV
jgi:segregation and condensation protein A